MKDDLPRDELMKLASDALQQYPGAEVHFKFTCSHCGERCTLEDPNCLYESGICHQCGQETVITKGGFLLALKY